MRACRLTSSMSIPILRARKVASMGGLWSGEIRGPEGGSRGGREVSWSEEGGGGEGGGVVMLEEGGGGPGGEAYERRRRREEGREEVLRERRRWERESILAK